MINIEYKVLQMKPLGTRKNPSPRWDSNPRPSIEGADEMQALRETWMTREEHLKFLCHVFHSSLAPRVYFARSLIFFHEIREYLRSRKEEPRNAMLEQ